MSHVWKVNDILCASSTSRQKDELKHQEGSKMNLEKVVLKRKRNNFVVRSYAGQSIGGCDEFGNVKTNQDALVMLEDPSTTSLVIACFDGHGTHGHIISKYFKIGIETRLLGHHLWQCDPGSAVTELLKDLEQEICGNENVETQFSGTTIVLAIIRESRLIVINVGDSRAILGSVPLFRKSSLDSDEDFDADFADVDLDRTGYPVPIPLTCDHKPDVAKELSRILKSGGRVCSISEEGPLASQRVWLRHANIPGLAMSRSLCDEVAATVGVISTPEIMERELDEFHDCFLILGTDGLWDCISNEEVLEIITAIEECTPGQCVKSLMSEAKQRWLSEYSRQDDITLCVASLLGSKPQKKIN